MASDSSPTNSTYGGASDPCAVVLFGASGDLAKRKVIPALFDLATHNSLGSRYAIVGFARTPMNDDSFRSATGEAARTMSDIGPVRAPTAATTSIQTAPRTG
jgi:glucose-6-phosphate 1-dehydrogenase